MPGTASFSISATPVFKGSLFKQAAKYPELFDKEIRRSMNESTLHLQAKVKKATPINTATAANSIGTSIQGKGVEIEGRVGSPLRRIMPLEFGRSAGSKMPPVEAISLWFTRKGIAPAAGRTIRQAVFLIARSLGRKGFKGRPDGWQMFQNAYKNEKSKVVGFFKQARDRIVARLK